MQWRTDDLGDPGGGREPYDWPVDVVATDNGVIAVRGGATWWTTGFDPHTGQCQWKDFDNGEGGFAVSSIASQLIVQRTNCAPLVVDPATGRPVAWINPKATPDHTGSLNEDYCGSCPDLAFATSPGTVIAAAATSVLALRP